MGYTTLNGVQLQIPTRATKNWDAVMLNTTWANIAAHDHTGNPKGNQLGAGSLANNAITNAKFRQSVGTSVVGRSAGTTGDVADIVAGADDQVLRRSGGTLSWGTLTPASLAALTVSRAVVTDPLGLISTAATTAVEIGYVNGVSSPIQTQFSTVNTRVTAAQFKVGVANLAIRKGIVANTVTLCSADGTALSASNIGYVTMQSTATPGNLITLQLTANQSFTDTTNGSDIDGMVFGAKTGTAWTPPRPFYFYMVNSDDTAAGLYLAVSPAPNLSQMPASTALIGYKTVPSGTASDSAVFISGSAITPANFTSKPMIRIGGLVAVKTNGDEWSFSSPSSGGYATGISDTPHSNTVFTWAAGEAFGSAASRYFDSTNSPSWATPANIIARYMISGDGTIKATFHTGNAGNCSNGGSAAGTVLVLPFGASFYFYSLSSIPGFIGYVRTNNVIADMTSDLNATNPNNLFLYKGSITTAVPQNSFLNAADDIYLTYTYQGF